MCLALGHGLVHAHVQTAAFTRLVQRTAAAVALPALEASQAHANSAVWFTAGVRVDEGLRATSQIQVQVQEVLAQVEQVAPV